MDSNDSSNLTSHQLQQLLEIYSMSQPDNKQIKQSTELLKQYSSNITSLEGFISQMSTNNDSKARQLAAVLLFKIIDKHWHKLTKEQQGLMSNTIISLYQNEKVYLVLLGLANIIFKIVKNILVTHEWNTQFDFIFAPSTNYSNEQAYLFELNLHIIAELVNSSIDYLKPKLKGLKEILSVALAMGSQRMKENATRCLGNLIANLEKEEINEYKDIGILMFKEMNKFSDKTIMKCYETLCDFNNISFDFFNNHFDQIIPLTLQLLSGEYNNQIKILLSEFLLMVAQYKKKLYTQNGCDYLKKFIQIAFGLLTAIQNEDETNLYNESTCFHLGLNMINMITNTISSKYTFPLFMQMIETSIKSQSPITRRATIGIIGEITEGCVTPMKDEIETFVNLVTHTFYNDENEGVKNQCIIAIDLLCQYCEPEINEYYDKIIPMLYQGLFSKHEKIIQTSLIELYHFCSNIDFDIEDYLNNNSEMNQKLLSKILEILNTTKSMEIQRRSLDALGAFIQNVKLLQTEGLIPILETLQNITLNKTTVNDQTLIKSTLTCVANISVVVKIEKFASFESYFSTFAFECIKSSVYELQNGGLCYFGSLADIKLQAFSPYIDAVMEHIFRLIKDSSGIVEKNKNKDEFGFDSDSEDEDDKEGNEDVYWNNEFMDAKYAAIRDLGAFSKACPVEFIKYFKDSLKILDEFIDYINDSLKFAVIETYEELMLSLELAVKTINDSQSLSNLPFNIQNLWVNEIFIKYETIINDSEDQELVAKAIESIYFLINHFGKELFVNNNTLNRCILITKKFLNNEMNCQIKNSGIDEDDELDHEEEIFESVQDLFLILAEKLGDEFHPYFTELFPLLKTYLKPSRPEEDRSLAFGCIAEILKYTKISVKFFIDSLFQSIDENLKLKKTKKNEQLFRHIAYLIGILFYSDPIESRKYLNSGLNSLQLIFEKSQKVAKDNVISSLGRIIIGLSLTKETFPLFDKVFETIMNTVPLKYDPLENNTLIELFIYLVNIFNLEDYQKYINSIMKIINIVIVNDAKCNTKEEEIAKVKMYLETIMKNEIIKELIQKNINDVFSQNEKEKFFSILNK